MGETHRPPPVSPSTAPRPAARPGGYGRTVPRRPILALLAIAVVAAALLAGCGSDGSDGSAGEDRPVTTTAPLRTTLLDTAPVTLPDRDRPAGASSNAIGYEVPGTGGVWIEPNGDAVVVDCTVEDPSPAIRAAAIAGYRGIWTCV